MTTEQESDQLQLKQELLKSEILDKNLDQMKFLQYCISQKENGDDLNNWTMEELKTCVLNFQESLKPKEQEPKQTSSLNFFLSSAKTNNTQQSQTQQNSQNQSFPYQNNLNIYNNSQSYQNLSSYQQYQISQQNYQQSYQQYNNLSYQSQQQQYNPSLSLSNIQGNQVQQGPALIQSVTLLNPLQQMLNSEKMQQRINLDIQNVNLEHTNRSPPKTKFEIICKKAEKTVLNDKEVK